MSTPERWLLLIVSIPLVLATLTAAYLTWRQWRRRRRARETNRRLNHLD